MMPAAGLIQSGVDSPSESTPLPSDDGIQIAWRRSCRVPEYAVIDRSVESSGERLGACESVSATHGQGISSPAPQW